MNSTQQLDGMPSELLKAIFGHFAEPQFKDLQTLDNWKQGYGSPWRECKNVLKSLRLVCRRFRDLTSPLLFSYLSISVEQSSVQRADKISRQPHLASCIRGVVIHTGLYDLRMVDSLDQHQNRVSSELANFLQPLLYNLPNMEYPEKSRERARLRAMHKNLEKLFGAWGQATRAPGSLLDLVLPDTGHKSDTRHLDALPHRKILEDGYKVFKECMAQARQYLKTGAFANDLVACLIRLPNLATVEMDAQRRAPIDPQGVLEGNDLEALAEFVESGLQGAWKAPDPFRDGHFAHIMTILPTKLYDAGIRLRTLRLSMFPFAAPHSLNTQNGTSDSHRSPDQEASMQSLADAFRTLESVTVNMYFETDPYWQEFADDYLCAVLGSPALHELEMFVPLPVQAFGGQALDTTAYRVGQLLSARSPGCLRRVHLRGLMLQEAILEGILIKCSHTWLDDVYLRDGLWANIVDKVMAARSLDKRLDRQEIHLSHVKGGEMGHILLVGQMTAAEEREYECLGYGGTEPVVLLMAEEYLRGGGTVERNPFREHKNNASYFRCRRPVVLS
ncbi:hypothetical protein LLEC1_03727 [Akanthomyces lecanii]|uniref:F-box domain-containing protein n=1 Tax=Cordyceps confragosa TaxID=2714763 RepID=A0A179ICZ0_CORDF|nr:hypothetical protein LLEC1_03727 [Akanthomyces lecanii]